MNRMGLLKRTYELVSRLVSVTPVPTDRQDSAPTGGENSERVPSPRIRPTSFQPARQFTIANISSRLVLSSCTKNKSVKRHPSHEYAPIALLESTCPSRHGSFCAG